MEDKCLIDLMYPENEEVLLSSINQTVEPLKEIKVIRQMGFMLNADRTELLVLVQLDNGQVATISLT